MTPQQFIEAARVPESLEPQSFGLWTIRRIDVNQDSLLAKFPAFRRLVGFDSWTLLNRFSTATMHTDYGETVMEDSRRELSRHLPIWLHAEGNVLVTGLGLGCVVRGLLANPAVERITVVEIDSGILRVVGKEFEANGRVELIHGDALKVDLGRSFDYAWHDLHTDGPDHLQVLHLRLIKRFKDQCSVQGAWQYPREFKRRMPEWMLR